MLVKHFTSHTWERQAEKKMHDFLLSHCSFYNCFKCQHGTGGIEGCACGESELRQDFPMDIPVVALFASYFHLRKAFLTCEDNSA